MTHSASGLRRWLSTLAPGVLLGSVGFSHGSPLLRVGETARELVIARKPATSYDGRPVLLAQLTHDGPVMLVFLRGFS